jgi:hypothetical protein
VNSLLAQRPVMTAPHRFAVNGNDLPLAYREYSLHLTGEAFLELLGIQRRKKPPKRVVRRNPPSY